MPNKQIPESLRRMVRMETKGTAASTVGNVDTVQKTLEADGVEFIAENGGGAGVRLAKSDSGE